MCAAHNSALALPFVSTTDRSDQRNQLSILAVEPALDDLLSVVASLSESGFHVTAAEGFAQAKPLLTTHGPRILMTAARLGMYNGLHLVLRGKSLQPGLAALVTSDVPDRILQEEVEALGATFVTKPISTSHLVAAILQTVYRRDPDGPPIRPPFERRSADRRASITPFGVERRNTDRRRLLDMFPPTTPVT
jgi:DNA-binding response OmpR family regulator